LESNIGSILSGEQPTEEVAQEQQTVETPEVEQEQTTEETGTGEQDTGTPPEQAKKDEPLDKAAEGLKAAATAERRKRQEAEQRAMQLQTELERLRATQQQSQQQVQHQERDEDPKPLRSQFESEDEWLDARDTWRDRQRAREDEARKQEAAQAELRTKTEGIVAQAMALEGFDLQAFARVPVTDAMFDAILESDDGPKLVLYLQTNPDDAERIAKLPAARQIKELARIEDRLATAAEESETAPTPKQKPVLPNTLTQARDTRGRFDKKDAYQGPTPLTDILK
jgi:hypothetical protein